MLLPLDEVPVHVPLRRPRPLRFERLPVPVWNPYSRDLNLIEEFKFKLQRRDNLLRLGNGTTHWGLRADWPPSSWKLLRSRRTLAPRNISPNFACPRAIQS